MNAAAPVLRQICASQTNYRLSFVFDTGTVVALVGLGVYYSADATGWEWLSAIASFIAGAFVFTFIEYAMHRWLYHAKKGFASENHHVHHVDPFGPSAMPCPCGSIVTTLLWCLCLPALGKTAASFFIGGMATGYLYYGVLHHLHHHIRVSIAPAGWLKTRWRAHARHHACVDRNFGVTTSLWDHLFGTT